MTKNAIILLLIICSLSQFSFSQLRVSSSTDISLQRNFKKQQRFWALGQNIVLDLHLTPVNGIYFTFCYYSPEKVKTPLLATAKATSTIPQQIAFVNRAKIRFK